MGLSASARDRTIFPTLHHFHLFAQLHTAHTCAHLSRYRIKQSVLGVDVMSAFGFAH